MAAERAGCMQQLGPAAAHVGTVTTSSAAPAALLTPQDVGEDAQLLGRLVHSMHAPQGDTDAQYEMLLAAQVGFFCAAWPAVLAQRCTLTAASGSKLGGQAHMHSA